jgi:hypothetical protein
MLGEMSTVQESAAVAPQCDPLLALMPLPHRAEFHPYGFAVSVASNSPMVLNAARQSWAGLPKRFDEPPLELLCIVSEGAGPECPPPPVVRAQRNLTVWTADTQNHWCCDMVTGFGSAWVTGRLVENTRYLRYHVLEAMAYSLLGSLHVVALHAACVALDGHGVLLAGDSGSGKSSLAYACARRGWTYVADDCSQLVRRSRVRAVLGDPRLFRFRATAGALFPEFEGMEESPHARGKPTIEVRTNSLPAIRTAVESHVYAVVFLNRRDGRDGQAELLPLAGDDAMKRLSDSPWPPDLPTMGERAAVLERLAGAGAYEMRYRDLDAAANKLEQMIARLGTEPGPLEAVKEPPASGQRAS